jgi:hypothetical protein
MPTPKPPLPLPFIKGQNIYAGPLEVLRKAVEWLVSKTVVSVTAPLQIRETPGGTTISLIPQFDRTVGVTSSDFLGRSGTTQATGTFTPYVSTAAGVLTVRGADLTALNFTGSTLASGVTVIAILVDSGWQLVAADCSGEAI